jgi:methyl-accepting chemotaxis protein
MTALKGYWGSRVKTLSEGSAEIVASMEEMQDSLGDRYSDALPDLPGALLNSPGPSWVGTPLAALFGDPVEQMADLLRDFINSFTFADSPIIQLLNAISEKIAQIERLITKISDIIDALAALLEMLELSSIYAAVETEGGAAAFFANAATAEGVPNVGPHGFGIGAVGLLTSPSAASFESLFELFGADVKNAISGVGSAVQQINRAADDVVRESEDVGEAFSGIEYD